MIINILPATNDSGALVLHNLVVHLDGLDSLDLGHLDGHGLHDSACLLNSDNLETAIRQIGHAIRKGRMEQSS
jgi:hypothetical protein